MNKIKKKYLLYIIFIFTIINLLNPGYTYAGTATYEDFSLDGLITKVEEKEGVTISPSEKKYLKEQDKSEEFTRSIPKSRINNDTKTIKIEKTIVVNDMEEESLGLSPKIGIKVYRATVVTAGLGEDEQEEGQKSDTPSDKEDEQDEGQKSDTPSGKEDETKTTSKGDEVNAVLDNVDKYVPRGVEVSDNVEDFTIKIMNILIAVGVIVSIVMIAILGFKFILGSPEQKAVDMGYWLIYLTGAVLMVAGAAIVRFILNSALNW